MDMTSENPSGRQVVTAYGDGRIRISGTPWEQPVLIMPERTVAWSATEIAAMTADSLAPVLEHDPGIEILLFGCGPRMVLIPPEIKALLRDSGIVSDPMDTGAACRTYNVLVAENRRVAAAVLPV